MSIRVENVSYVYYAQTPMEKHALYNINMTVEDGEFVGLIGHTGSGKSTLIQHFNGLLKPTSGKIFIDDEDITKRKMDLRSIRTKVGMVFQYPEHQLFGETVYEDVAFGPSNLGLSGDALEQRVSEALAMVDLEYDQCKMRSPFALSGGQKRRVAIAGVLAMKPKVLILDEPTAGLDPKGRDEILDQVERLHQEWKLTVILVTHSMEDVARLATRLIVMNHGAIAIEGTCKEVFRQAEYLEGVGLGIPQVTSLLRELNKRGFDVVTDSYTLDDAEKEIVKLLELKEHGNV